MPGLRNSVLPPVRWGFKLPPMLRLLLLRHGKAEPASAKLDDHERPLNGRGRIDAKLVGEYLKAGGNMPALVLCSTSLRTRETWAAMASVFGRTKPHTQFERDLYLAIWPRLLTMIKATPAKASPVLLIGHNPGIEQLAFALALKPKTADERTRLETLAGKFPTATLAVLDLDAKNWAAAAQGQFRLTDFVKPKDLPGYDEDED